MSTPRPVDRLLAHLQLARELPSLDYLNRIVAAHQRRVPFETLTKLIDYEPGSRRGDFMPSMTDYVDRIVTRGAGGLCWTLARGFKALLDDLGFDASLMVMHPGHCCVRVELPDGPFYADVGYAAPLFQAYPLFTSFSIDTHREAFEYRVSDEGILVTRRPGPTKTLDTTPRRIEELAPLIAAANDWSAPQSFLHRLSYGRYVGDVYRYSAPTRCSTSRRRRCCAATGPGIHDGADARSPRHATRFGCMIRQALVAAQTVRPAAPGRR